MPKATTIVKNLTLTYLFREIKFIKAIMFSKTHTKYIQSLHHKKFRDEYGVFIAEGTKVVLEFLAADKFECKQLFALPDWFLTNAKAIPTDVEQIEVKDFELEKISALSTPNKVLAVFQKSTLPQTVVGKHKITLVLDAIQDPGNMGTIIRNADWFGVQNIVCSLNSADIYNPKVVQSSMGSLARVNVVYKDLLAWLKENNQVDKFAADLNGEDVSSLKNIKEAIIIIGNEGKGISDDVMELVDKKITIKKIGKAESLNAAVASGIILAFIG
ncbi:MAG: RNA methyltransferase [Ferruginibacter sp.]|nr:RNA methyltransferase [Ferruginibacter sp.]